MLICTVCDFTTLFLLACANQTSFSSDTIKDVECLSEGNYSMAGICEWSTQPREDEIRSVSRLSSRLSGFPTKHECRRDRGWVPIPYLPPRSLPPSFPPPSSSLLLPLCNTNPVIFHSAVQTAVFFCWGGGWEGNNKHRGANGQHMSIPETDRCRGSLRSKKRIPPHPSLSVAGKERSCNWRSSGTH